MAASTVEITVKCAFHEIWLYSEFGHWWIGASFT